ncbi:uncharacterized protein LOC121372984 isoform X2 [Gigantopelta aegis]|uniref:uncharacterized protein LOC121372984 isoform X2 n=1 Tax=Gigantopelta aegis TaxID=1735272 RepID=UPI001B88D32F|nr:uncharacterized protein LOC121372984 isoform X2 [Gigantopelta aegis]
MMKRKIEDIQEQCDEWLSTRNRKKVRPAEKFPKRSRLARVMSMNSSLWQLTQNSQPPLQLKTTTKQSSLLSFFKSSDLKKTEFETTPHKSLSSSAEQTELDDVLDNPVQHLSVVSPADLSTQSPADGDSAELNDSRETTLKALRESGSNTIIDASSSSDTDSERLTVADSPGSKIVLGQNTKSEVFEDDKKENFHDNLACNYSPVINEPRCFDHNEGSSTRRLETNVQSLKSLQNSKPRENENCDHLCDRLCTESLQFSDSCYETLSLGGNMYSKQYKTSLHCRHGDDTPSFDSENTIQFTDTQSCDISFHSPLDDTSNQPDSSDSINLLPSILQ